MLLLKPLGPSFSNNGKKRYIQQFYHHWHIGVGLVLYGFAFSKWREIWKFLVLLADYFLNITELSFLVLVRYMYSACKLFNLSATRALEWCNEFLYLWYILDIFKGLLFQVEKFNNNLLKVDEIFLQNSEISHGLLKDYFFCALFKALHVLSMGSKLLLWNPILSHHNERLQLNLL